jgi:SAM-dependent methyltransferase
MLEIRKAFDQVADTYDEWYREPAGRYAFKAELKALDHLLPSHGLGAEIGAGTGIFARDLSADGRTVICLDISLAMLRKVVDRELQAIAGATEFPPIRHEALDFVYLVTVLEFLLDPLAALSSLRPSIKPSHPLVILCINSMSEWGDLYSKLSEEGHLIFRHAHLYKPEEVIKLLEEAGYRISEVLGTLTNPPEVVPKDEPNFGSLTDMPNAGVFLVKGLRY